MIMNNNSNTISITELYYTDAWSDKVYNCKIEYDDNAYSLIAEYGRRGAHKLNRVLKYKSHDIKLISSIYDNLIASKMKKGYKISSHIPIYSDNIVGDDKDILRISLINI